MLSRIVLIDDSDSSIQYTCTGGGSWIPGGTSTEFNGTTHGTSSAACCISYNFTGTSIAVYGTIPGYHNGTQSSAGPTSRYFIDDLDVPSFIFNATPNEDSDFQQLFFSSDSDLSDRPHLLKITLDNDTMVDGTAGFWVDFFVVGRCANHPIPSPSPSPSPAKSESHRRSSLSVGPITGGVVGGVVLLVLLAGILFMYFRRRQKRRRSLGSFDSLSEWSSTDSDSLTTMSFLSTSDEHIPPSESYPDSTSDLLTDSGSVADFGRRSTYTSRRLSALSRSNYISQPSPIYRPGLSILSTRREARLGPGDAESAQAHADLPFKGRVAAQRRAMVKFVPSKRRLIIGLGPGESASVQAEPRNSPPPSTIASSYPAL